MFSSFFDFFQFLFLNFLKLSGGQFIKIVWFKGGNIRARTSKMGSKINTFGCYPKLYHLLWGPAVALKMFDKASPAQLVYHELKVCKVSEKLKNLFGFTKKASSSSSSYK